MALAIPTSGNASGFSRCAAPEGAQRCLQIGIAEAMPWYEPYGAWKLIVICFCIFTGFPSKRNGV